MTYTVAGYKALHGERREYRLVTGMRRHEAILEIAKVWLEWNARVIDRPGSLIVKVQIDGEPVMQTYSYECPTFATALAITESVFDAKAESTDVRIEWL